MDSLPYWRVDAFVGEGMQGNPAAIIECTRWLDDREMIRIASESGGSATAFLVPDESGAADWQLRWFASTGEIALCGHATMASAHLLLVRFGAESVTFRTRRAGLLEARLVEGNVELGLPAIASEPTQLPELVECIGAQPLEIHCSEDGYAVLFFESEEDIRALSPDFHALAALGDLQISCTAPGKNSDVVSRVFTRAGGEDSVTGSAHAAMAAIWCEKLGSAEFTAIQASQRGGRLTVRLEEERVYLTGQCATVIEGTFYLTG